MRLEIKPKEDLIGFLEENFEKFTLTQKRITNYLLSNKYEASFLTADEMAAEIGTASSTIVRFAKDIGYSGYPGLQKDLRKLVIKKINYIGQLEKARKFAPPEEETVISLSLMKDLANMHKLIEMRDEEKIRRFVDIFISSRRRFIIANRSAFSVGHIFFYEIRKIIPSVFLLNNLDGGIYDFISEINTEDVVVAISFPRYAKLTINFAEYSKKKGSKVISITQNKISPLFKVSEVSLFCPYEGPTFLNSNVAVMALINAIISEIFNRSRNSSIQLLENEESILLKLDVIELKGKKIEKD
jgi:DNA-binding MurR/RpiR family transcriptional regulator